MMGNMHVAVEQTFYMKTREKKLHVRRKKDK